MKNGGVFRPVLTRKRVGFICELRGHLLDCFCHVFFSGVLDSEIQGGIELRMTHPKQRGAGLQIRHSRF